MAEQQTTDKRIVLICLDGSEPAKCAFDWYLKNMKQSHDYVYGIIVPEYNLSGVSVFKMVGPLSDVKALSNEFKTQHEAVESLCADYTASLRSMNIKGQVDAVGSNGKPGEVICEKAESLHADCIIMGTRGLSKVKSWMVGSVSNYVLNHAKCPVTIVPNKK